MKKTIFLLLMCFVAIHYAGAQHKKIYVSRHGGTKKLVLFGNIGYSNYHFTNYQTSCDSLLCSGSGYETCNIDKGIIAMAKEEGVYYPLFNKAIRATKKHARRTKKDSGQFHLVLQHKTLSVSYSHADRKGNADIDIEVL